MPEVPERLQDKRFRFVKIQKKKKGPFEKGWQDYNNYKWNEEEFKEWDGNYGVVCGFGDLTVIDADTEKVEERIEENLPATFTVETGGGGKHYYFLCKDIEKPIRLKQEEYGDLGDVQYEGKQVVGPGSLHPSGNTYSVLEDKKIQKVSVSDIKSALSDLIKNKNTERVKRETEEQKEEHGLDFDLSITDVLNTSGLDKRGREYQGSHPVHGSQTGENFCVNTKKNVWHCFRHNTGGGPLSWLAVREGIIDCSDAVPGSLTGDKFKEVLQIVKDECNVQFHGRSTKNSKSQGNKGGTIGTGSSNSLEYRNLDINIDNLEKPVPEVPENIWEKMNSLFHSSDYKSKECRYQVAQMLQKVYNFVTHPKTETLYVFNDCTYKPKGKQLIRKKCRKNLGSNVTDHDVREIVSMIKDENYVDMEEFEVGDLLIPTKNYDLRLENGGDLEKLDISPERVVMSRIPWEYKEDADCPEIKSFIEDIVNDEWVDTIQEMVGLCLANKKITRKAFMLYGSGSNGKDVLLDLIEELLGSENVSNHTLHYLEYNRFAAAGLVGKLANISGDLSNNELSDSSVFKRITGGSTIEVEEKGKQSYRYKPYATLVFAANQTPSFEEDTYALYDRWMIITFPYTFTSNPDDNNKDKIPKNKLIDKLTTKEEMEGFLKWAVDGLRRVLENDGRITNQQPPEKIKEAWEKRSDSITAFAKNRIEKAPDNVIAKRKLYEKYRDWCVKNNYTPESMQQVGSKLPRKSPATKGQKRIGPNNKKTKVWKGIKLKPKDGKRVGKSDLLEYYPERVSNPENYQDIKDKAASNLDISGERFDEIHKKLQEDGDIHEARLGQFKKL